METHERIVLKAHELFMRYGIRSVSMDEIASQLGMSKKTIYQFHTDKDTLVEGVIDIVIAHNQSACGCHHEKSENAIQEIFFAVDMVQELVKHMNPSVMYDLKKYHEKAFRKFQEHKNRFLFDIIKSNLERGKAEELYREEIQVDLLTRFRLATMFLMFDPESFPPTKYSPAQIITEITDNFLYGLATPKGQKLIQKYKQQRQKK